MFVSELELVARFSYSKKKGGKFVVPSKLLLNMVAFSESTMLGRFQGRTNEVEVGAVGWRVGIAEVIRFILFFSRSSRYCDSPHNICIAEAAGCRD